MAFFLLPWCSSLSLLLFLFITFLSLLLRLKTEGEIFWYFCCLYDLSKKSLFTLRYYELFLELLILLLSRLIYFDITRPFISELSTGFLSIFLYLLETDKIFNFFCLSPIAWLKMCFLRIATIQS